MLYFQIYTLFSTLYGVCCVRVVCPLAVVKFNLHCLGSDLRPFEVELLHFMLFL